VFVAYDLNRYPRLTEDDFVNSCMIALMVACVLQDLFAEKYNKEGMPCVIAKIHAR
jgi:hypothetical protein